ncbi:hypothetical protein ISCGN_007276 [Ixodes scapularis]
MASRVPLAERRNIIELSIQGVSQRQISNRTGRSLGAVNRIIQAYRDEDGRIEDAHRRGRPRSSSEEVDQLIVAAVVVDPFQNAREIKDALQIDLSESSIRRRLQEAGLGSCIAAQKPYLTDRQKRQCLNFACSHERRSVTDWGEVVFTDESTFLSRWDQQRHVWRPYNCRAVQALLEERALGWTPKGAYFNIIENIWGLLKHHMSRLNLVTATPDDLWRAVKAEWDQLRKRDGLVNSLYQSLPQRIAEAISVNRAFTS